MGLVCHEPTIPLLAKGVDVFGCAQCDGVVTQTSMLTCRACECALCPEHEEEGPGMKLCDQKYCDAYLCLLGECAQNDDPLNTVDDDGDPLAVQCDDCGKWACWCCASRVDSDDDDFYDHGTKRGPGRGIHWSTFQLNLSRF